MSAAGPIPPSSRRPGTSSAGWSTVVATPPATYAIQVDGHLDDHWSGWLGDAEITRDARTTTVTVSVVDQAQLHGVLARLRDMGAVLIELRATCSGRA
jgi:hypothetical protein